MFHIPDLACLPKTWRQNLRVRFGTQNSCEQSDARPNMFTRLLLVFACLSSTTLALTPGLWRNKATSLAEEAAHNKPTVGGARSANSPGWKPMASRRNRRRANEASGAEEEEEEVSPDWAYVMGICGTAATFIIGHALEEKGVSWIPEAAVGLMIGFFIAAFATEGWIGPLAFPWAHHMRFDYEFFMTFLLPPIIFEAGFNMQVPPRVQPPPPPPLHLSRSPHSHPPFFLSTHRSGHSSQTSARPSSSPLSAPSPRHLSSAALYGTRARSACATLSACSPP